MVFSFPRSLRTLVTTVVILCELSKAAAAHVIDHDKVQGFPDSATNSLLKTFQPFLKVFNGCVPFPAVDAAGNVSGGLKPSGAMDGHCSKSTGQVYGRAQMFRGQCANMYAWYFPKEQNVDGPGNRGHRHGWQNIIVWTETCNTQARVISVSYSAHGFYDQSTTPFMKGTHPLVGYQRDPFPLNPSLVDTDIQGGMQPAISWFDLTPEARNTLETYDFGKGVPFNEYNYLFNLSKGRL
ncbi:NPP1 family protein [Rhizobium sp. 268]|uniref:NPP1 family protein n=1 Tax=Rhizobium sp. 268 TaxID=2996375 RepID=UPI002F95A977